MIKGLIALGGGLLLGMIWGINFHPIQALANQAYGDAAAALKHAPQGILLSKYFAAGTGKQVQIIPAPNPQIKDTEAVQLTNGTNQIGSIWSNDQNYFDLTKEQTVSMWLYFGNKNISAGDGMAFVLQNDALGQDATIQQPNILPFGESLGVWGSDDQSNQGNPKKVAASAIQHSWALEFDTYQNDSVAFEDIGKGNAFDADHQEQDAAGKHLLSRAHIASNYPGEENSYATHQVSNLPKSAEVGNYVTLHHQGILQEGFSFLSNGEWHHITLHYQPTKKGGRMTYTFNDKDAKTGASQPGISAKVEIDKHKIDPENRGFTYWGFTGSTGKKWEDNIVVFDQMPDLVEATANATLKDLTQQTQISGAKDRVAAGDRVQLNYQVEYLKGRSGWHDVKAKLRLPPNISFEKGFITSTNGSVRNISPEKLAQHEVDQSIAEQLNQSQSTANITLLGRVNEGQATVAAFTSHFYGTEAVTEASTPDFTVEEPERLQLKLNQTDLAISSQQALSLKGTISATKALIDKNVEIRLKGKGISMAWTVVPKGENQQVTLKVPTENLQPGPNQLTVTAVSETGHAAKPVTVNIFVGQLDFGTVSKNLDFKTNLTGQAQWVHPNQPLHLTVADTRRTAAQWRVMAKVDSLKKEGQPDLAGKLVYSTPGGQQTDLSQEAVLITPPKKAVNNVTVLAGEQDDDGHVALHVRSDAVAGIYSEKITWVLANAVT
ncbi:lectin-like domain-containing protein [Levilactobacillus yiduensis]|uniref:lectin-like domain-containing protein n=1 Tax=Levilactobacillus yiduensis TaxID=2953880 RepID=UPI000EF2E4EA|nr:hypothetical protein [Levilactobacillus yiduensis]AYM03901.1 hypothetical protein D8911_13280 [Levilactobacillus brevis]